MPSLHVGSLLSRMFARTLFSIDHGPYVGLWLSAYGGASSGSHDKRAFPVPQVVEETRARALQCKGSKHIGERSRTVLDVYRLVVGWSCELDERLKLYLTSVRYGMDVPRRRKCARRWAPILPVFVQTISCQGHLHYCALEGRHLTVATCARKLAAAAAAVRLAEACCSLPAKS